MAQSTISRVRHAALVAALVGATSSLLVVGPVAAEKYSRHTVTNKASFYTLQKHGRALEHDGVAKLTKIRRHGRVVGFKKRFAKPGDTVIVKRGRQGRVRTATLKRKSFLQRWKHKLAFFKGRNPRYRSNNRRGAYNGFRHRDSRLR